MFEFSPKVDVAYRRHEPALSAAEFRKDGGGIFAGRVFRQAQAVLRRFKEPPSACR